MIRYLGWSAVGVLLGTGALAACSGTGGGNEVGNGGNAAGGSGGSAAAAASGGTGGGAASGGTGAVINVDGSTDGALTDATACSGFQAQAEIKSKPADVIFIIDNSCSMSQEIAGVEANITTNLANVLGSAGVDYRVIVISENGLNTSQSICIGPPLGNTSCPAPNNTPPVNNPPLFFHYDNDDVESWDGWCKSAKWIDQSDQYGLAPGGWKEWLRQDALKAFVMVTDDRVNCNYGATNPGSQCTSGNSATCFNDLSGGQNAITAAQNFDKLLLSLAPTQFGTEAARNYVWHTVAGIGANPNHPLGAWEPSEAIVTTQCSPGSVNVSWGNQELSRLTGGLRLAACGGNNFDAVFQAIAQDVVQGAKLACEFDMPEPPEGKSFDPDTITVSYTPNGTGTPQIYTKVPNAAACTAGGFYIESDRVYLCPDACTVVQGDDNAKLDLLVDCVKEGPA